MNHMIYDRKVGRKQISDNRKMVSPKATRQPYEAPRYVSLYLT